jgi:hypothetical protein
MKDIKIEFSISGTGDVYVKAKDSRDAIRQFDEMDMKELAGWCSFSSYERSGIHIISIDDEEVQADLWDVKKDMGVDDEAEDTEEVEEEVR